MQRARTWKIAESFDQRTSAKEKSSSLAKRTTEKAGPKVVAVRQNGRAIRNFRQETGPRRRKITALSEFKESSKGVCRPG